MRNEGERLKEDVVHARGLTVWRCHHEFFHLKKPSHTRLCIMEKRRPCATDQVRCRLHNSRTSRVSMSHGNLPLFHFKYLLQSIFLKPRYFSSLSESGKNSQFLHFIFFFFFFSFFAYTLSHFSHPNALGCIS